MYIYIYVYVYVYIYIFQVFHGGFSGAKGAGIATGVFEET
jgi:hypothetical protein